MDIIKSVIHWILTAIAMTLAALIFLISHERLWIDWIKSKGIEKALESFPLNLFDSTFLKFIFPYGVYAIFLLMLIGITALSLNFIIKKLDKIKFKKKQISSFEQANDFYLPIYLGYAFVAISLPPWKSFLLFFLLMLILLSKTRFFYFNPLFLILGYKFYFIDNVDKSKMLLITKKEVKVLSDFFENSVGIEQEEVALIRVNNHTYLLI